MGRSRRFLPSVRMLAAFEAVLRTGSTAAAARDLNVTQGAASRLIQELEQQLGRRLFERSRQRLHATPAALAYGADVSRALDLIERAGVQFAANPGGGVLSLAILPAFGTRWLAPRLGQFLNGAPGVTVNLASRLRPFDFAFEGFHAAIHFGADDWPSALHMKLFDERLTACASRALLAAHPIRSAEDLLTVQRFQIETRPNAWAAWFAGQGSPAPPSHGMLFDQFATMTQAAVSGLGVALLPDYLAATEIGEGRLEPLLKRGVEGTGAYWLVWPRSANDYPPLQAFRLWIAGCE